MMRFLLFVGCAHAGERALNDWSRMSAKRPVHLLPGGRVESDEDISVRTPQHELKASSMFAAPLTSSAILVVEMRGDRELKAQVVHRDGRIVTVAESQTVLPYGHAVLRASVSANLLLAEVVGLDGEVQGRITAVLPCESGDPVGTTNDGAIVLAAACGVLYVDLQGHVTKSQRPFNLFDPAGDSPPALRALRRP